MISIATTVKSLHLRSAGSLRDGPAFSISEAASCHPKKWMVYHWKWPIYRWFTYKKMVNHGNSMINHGWNRDFTSHFSKKASKWWDSNDEKSGWWWLELWNFMTFHSVGNVIIPTDEVHHFLEGYTTNQQCLFEIMRWWCFFLTFLCHGETPKDLRFNISAHWDDSKLLRVGFRKKGTFNFNGLYYSLFLSTIY